jgi:hypothetical protein
MKLGPRVRGVAAVVGAACAIALSSCGSSNGPVQTQVLPPTPVITAVSDSLLSPGDTLVVTGKNFASAATSNRAVFNNQLAIATPFYSSGDTLKVVVPPWATAGGLYVTSRGVKSNTKVVEITRGKGDVWVIGGSATFDFKLRSDTGGEQYLMIPYSASTGAITNYAYTVTPDTTTIYPVVRKGPSRSSVAATDLQSRFEVEMREQAYEYLRTHGLRRSAPQPRKSTAALSPPATTTFLVLKPNASSTTNPSSYKTITATLVHSGPAAYIYADVNQPAGSFDAADYAAFGDQFDTQIFPTDTTYFGPPSDIDQNGHIVILFTPEVNRLTPVGTAQSQGYIAGFFLPNDLGPLIFPAGTSNGMEIFYSVVPDPNADYGNQFTKTQISNVVPGTLAHEFQHMISFGYRFVKLGSLSFSQQTWLEEGMAHMAEDLNNMDAQNELRAGMYLLEPWKWSLMGSDGLQQRGGIWLFLRYLGDRLGDGIYRRILESTCVGRPCIENVTGENFFTSVADFLATLYLSNRGITSDPKYNYTSIDMQNFSLAVTDRSTATGAFNGTVQSATGAFFTLNGFQPPAKHFRVVGGAGGQVRVVAVRIQ